MSLHATIFCLYFYVRLTWVRSVEQRVSRFTGKFCRWIQNTALTPGFILLLQGEYECSFTYASQGGTNEVSASPSLTVRLQPHITDYCGLYAKILSLFSVTQQWLMSVGLTDDNRLFSCSVWRWDTDFRGRCTDLHWLNGGWTTTAYLTLTLKPAFTLKCPHKEVGPPCCDCVTRFRSP